MRYFLIALCLLLIPISAKAEATVALVSKTTAYGNISYPVISSLENTRAERRINQAIGKIVATWTCYDESDRQPTEQRLQYLRENKKYFSYNASSRIRLINDQLLSFTVGEDVFCGGAHPSENYQGYNFNLRTGRLIELKDLLKPEMQGEALTRFLVTGHKFLLGCTDKDDTARIYDPENFDNDHWSYYFIRGKMVFIPSLSHATWTCYEEFPIAIKDIKPYLRQ